MHNTFIVSPEAQRRFAETGLDRRIAEFVASRNGYLQGAIFSTAGTLADQWRLLRSEGYVPTKPTTEQAAFLNRIANDRMYTKRQWQVQKPAGVVSEDATIDDTPIYGGFFAAQMLNPTEFWQHEQFGFQSTAAFVGAIGASMRKRARFNEFQWDAGTALFAVYDTSGDIGIQRVDHTPYATRDPFEQVVPYRPIIESDVDAVILDENAWQPLMRGLLQYNKQTGRGLPFTTLRASKEYLARYPSSERSMQYALAQFEQFSVHKAELLATTELTGWPYTVRAPAPRGEYFLFIGPDQELVFTRFANPRTESEPRVQLVIPAAELPQLCNGLFAVASRRGPTTVSHLAAIVQEYYKPTAQKTFGPEQLSCL
jgi:hypothetical protein